MLLGGAVHIIGNVTKNADNSIKLEPINDCSGVTFYEGIWHVWHQCCQVRCAPASARCGALLREGARVCCAEPLGPRHLQGFDPLAAAAAADPAGDDEDVGRLDHAAAEGGRRAAHSLCVPALSVLRPGSVAGSRPSLCCSRLRLTIRRCADDAEDGKLGVHDAEGVPVGSGDRPILGVARLADLDDKYLQTWKRVENNPVAFEGAAGAFPGQVWKNDGHWNFIMQGNRYQVRPLPMACHRTSL